MTWRSLLGALGCVLAMPAMALEAHRLAPGEKIVVDGRLDERAWAEAERFDRFWETYPQAETPARVRTEMRVAYDAQAL